jgi:thioredoxin 1
MAQIVEVTDQSFESQVLKADRPVVIDFWAEWCAPCRAIAPIIKDLAAQYGDQVVIAKMDIEANAATPGRLGIRSIPTVLAFRGGRVVEQLVGARPKADFEAMVKKLLAA